MLKISILDKLQLIPVILQETDFFENYLESVWKSKLAKRLLKVRNFVEILLINI